jgi:hypothetical protein
LDIELAKEAEKEKRDEVGVSFCLSISGNLPDGIGRRKESS